MKKIGDRITYDKPKKDELFLEIKPLQNKKKQQLFSLWMLGWTACGLFVVVALFTQDFSKDEVLFMLIYLAMWLYFELKMLHAFRWQNRVLSASKSKKESFTT